MECRADFIDRISNVRIEVKFLGGLGFFDGIGGEARLAATDVSFLPSSLQSGFGSFDNQVAFQFGKGTVDLEEELAE